MGSPWESEGSSVRIEPVEEPAGPVSTVPSGPPPRVAFQGATTVRRGLLLVIVLAAGLVVLSARTVSLLARDLDPDLVSTDEIAEIEQFALPLFVAFIAVAAVVTWLTVRWMSRVRRTIRELATLGAVETAGGDVLFAAVSVPEERRTWLDAPVPATRRLPRAVVVGLAIALVGTVIAVVLRAAAAGPAGARLAAIAGLAAALAWVVMASLATALVENVDRRQRAGLRAAGLLADPVPEGTRAWAGPAMAILATLAAAFALGPSERPYDDRACPAPETSCHILTVQRDQVAGGPRGHTVEITFAVRPADRERRGTFFFITGGPGSSGILDGGLFLAQAPQRLKDAYDVVLFDARGVGRSEPLDCPTASGRYLALPDPDDLALTSGTFAGGCVAESGATSTTLPTYGSNHLAEDIEAIRAVLGVDRMVVYGSSYGTVIAQRYARRHPDHVEALMLDGPVDPAEQTADFWIEADGGFEATLSKVLASCSADERCAATLPDPAAAYERLLARLDGATIEARFAEPDGTYASHVLERAAVINAVADAMYDLTGRMLFLHALASSDMGDDVPLGRLVDAPPTPTIDPWSSAFAYYATLCADFTGPISGGASAYVEAGRRAGAMRGSLDTVYTSALPCLDWPGRRDGRLPEEPLVDTPFPVLVFSGGADPITPPSQALRIAGRLSNGYLFETTGGPHGTFARGGTCPDDAVLGLLLDGRRPETRTISCPGPLADPYVDVLPASVTSLRPIEIARAIDDEIVTDPGYRYWVNSIQTDFGCRYGGTVRAVDQGDADDLTLEDCEIFSGYPIDGTARFAEDGSTHFDIHLSDGDFTYDIDVNGVERASGVFRGAKFIDG